MRKFAFSAILFLVFGLNHALAQDTLTQPCAYGEPRWNGICEPIPFFFNLHIKVTSNCPPSEPQCPAYGYTSLATPTQCNDVHSNVNGGTCDANNVGGYLGGFAVVSGVPFPTTYTQTYTWSDKNNSGSCTLTFGFGTDQGTIQISSGFSGGSPTNCPGIFWEGSPSSVPAYFNFTEGPASGY